ncbi:MAG: tetratricopeptide repeat protein [Bacteroidales bacterium]|nr:tetratricopeptide repeat protein [Bacteroidales bacterium]
MNKILLVFLFFIFCVNNFNSQEIPDTLNNKLSGKSDYEKVNYLLKLATNFLNKDNETSYQLSKIAFNIAKNSGNKNLEVNAGMLYGKSSRYVKKFNEGIEVLSNVIDILTKVNHKEGLAVAYNEIGLCYKEQNNLKSAIDAFINSLNYFTSINDVKNINIVNNNLATTYLKAGQYKNAIEIFKKLKDYAEQQNNKKEVVFILNQIGVAYSNYGDILSAKKYFQEALSIAQSLGDNTLISTINTNINNLSKLEEAKKITAYEQEQQQQQQEYVASLQSQYEMIKQQRLKTLEEIEKLSYENQAKELKLHYIQSQYEKQVLENQIKEQQLKLKEIERKKIEAENAKQKEIVANQRRTLIIVLSALVIVFILLSFVIYFYVQNRRTLKIVREQKERIEQQKNEIEKINKELAHQNKIIRESIDYAKYIQFALLPSVDVVKKSFSDVFIFFKPRDVVSGDFYWYHSDNEKCWLATIDCTGHGVPGAFMSLITNTLLNKIVKEQKFVLPSKILSELNNNLLDTFSQSSEDFDFGMDITMCLYDKSMSKAVIALAGHSCLIINNKNEVNEIDGKEFIIGGGVFAQRNIEYKENEIIVDENTIAVFYSDGFSDQVGGFEKKKLGSKGFNNIIIDAVINNNFENVNNILQTKFDEWKGENKQLDDLIVIGVKF